MTNDDIIGIVCHEMGHWYHSHNVILMSIQFMIVFAFLGISKLFLFNEYMYLSFGFEKKELVMGFQLFGMFLAPLSVIMGILGNKISRRNEYQADRFAIRFNQHEALLSGLVKIHKENKADLDPDHLYST